LPKNKVLFVRVYFQNHKFNKTIILWRLNVQCWKDLTWKENYKISNIQNEFLYNDKEKLYFKLFPTKKNQESTQNVI